VGVKGLRIGLTGGIGSGKSTVADMWAKCGAHVVDLDAISRHLTAPAGAALAPLRAAFGPEIFDAQDQLNRSLLRDKVFANPSMKARLEAVLHPLIMQDSQAQAQLAAPDQPVVFDIPLLAESPLWRKKVDRIVVVDCSVASQITRVMQRSGWPQSRVQEVIDQQASRAQRLALADAVIVNEGASLAQLQKQVDHLYKAWFAS
jgi:dephospho-CoA kinase